MPWPSIDPGRLRHQVTILHQVPSEDISGTTMIWAPMFQTYAAIDPLSGTDAFMAGQLTTQLPITVSLNWQSGVLPNMRLLRPTGDAYEIKAVQNVQELNVTLVLTCVGIGLND